MPSPIKRCKNMKNLQCQSSEQFRKRAIGLQLSPEHVTREQTHRSIVVHSGVWICSQNLKTLRCENRESKPTVLSDRWQEKSANLSKLRVFARTCNHFCCCCCCFCMLERRSWQTADLLTQQIQQRGGGVGGLKFREHRRSGKQPKPSRPHRRGSSSLTDVTANLEASTKTTWNQICASDKVVASGIRGCSRDVADVRAEWPAEAYTVHTLIILMSSVCAHSGYDIPPTAVGKK